MTHDSISTFSPRIALRLQIDPFSLKDLVGSGCLSGTILPARGMTSTLLFEATRVTYPNRPPFTLGAAHLAVRQTPQNARHGPFRQVCTDARNAQEITTDPHTPPLLILPHGTRATHLVSKVGAEPLTVTRVELILLPPSKNTICVELRETMISQESARRNHDVAEALRRICDDGASDEQLSPYYLTLGL
jgi:hypothetical protein